MAREKFEARGALAATIDTRRAYDFDGGLAELIGAAEERFLARAREYAKARAEKVAAMRARERRSVRPEKITLVSSAERVGDVIKVTFEASLLRGGAESSRKKSIFFDEKTQAVVNEPKEKRKKARTGKISLF